MNPPDHTRLVPDEPLPPYTFVPGQMPHPVSDPHGHSYGVEPAVPPPPDPDHWQACKPYLFGLDLFNHQFFWEAHVQWESVWLACGKKGKCADFLKGLIKLAAAGVKHLEGKPAGVKSHAGRAAELFRAVGVADTFLGFAVARLAELAAKLEQEGWPAELVLLVPAPWK
jgi:hypothetical protein